MNDDKDIGYILIDPPVTPFSAEKDILAWIEELKEYPIRPEVKEALTTAYEMLERRKEQKL